MSEVKIWVKGEWDTLGNPIDGAVFEYVEVRGNYMSIPYDEWTETEIKIGKDKGTYLRRYWRSPITNMKASTPNGGESFLDYTEEITYKEFCKE